MMADVWVSEEQGIAVKTVPLFATEPDGGDNMWITFVRGEAINEAVALHRLMACNSPHIVQVYGIDVDAEKKTISFRERYLDRLPEAIEDPELVRKYIRDIFEGLYGMQRAGVTHGDIKLDNLMVDRDTGDLKYIDFGLSAIDLPGRSSQEVYTLFFRPPEVILRAKDYDTEKAEVWAAGVCAASLILKNKSLFVGENWSDVLSAIIGSVGRFSSSWETMPMWERFYDRWDGLKWEGPPLLERIEDPIARDFVSRCLSLNADKRGTVLELLHHPYIGGRELGGVPEVIPIKFHECDLALTSVFGFKNYSLAWIFLAELLMEGVELWSYPTLVAAGAISGIVKDKYLSLGRSCYQTCLLHTSCISVVTLLKIPATFIKLSGRYKIVTP